MQSNRTIHDHHETLYQHLARAREAWLAWERLFFVDDEEYNFQVDRTCPEFFDFLGSMLPDWVMLSLARLNDKKGSKGSISVQDTIRRVIENLARKKDPEWDSSKKVAAGQLKKLQSEFESVCEGLHDHRDRRIAHIDRVCGGHDEMAGLQPVIVNDIHSVFDALIEIMRHIEAVSGREPRQPRSADGYLRELDRLCDRHGAGQMRATIQNAWILQQLSWYLSVKGESADMERIKRSLLMNRFDNSINRELMGQ